METLEYKWQGKTKNFNFKVNKLQNEINEFKSTYINVSSKNDNQKYTKLNNNIKRRELISVYHYSLENNLENNLNKASNTYIEKENKNNKNKNILFPPSRNISNKIIKTSNVKTCEKVNSIKFNLRNKRRSVKNKNLNEKRWIIATKHVKIGKLNVYEKKANIENTKNKKTQLLYLEGEEGNLHAYPIYSDFEVGFENISNIEDEKLSKIKKENQDDDDVKTTKHLAQWSSDLVHKYLEEAIEKSKIIFQISNIKCRQEDFFKRMQS